MRLYTPAKSSSPGAEDGERRQEARSSDRKAQLTRLEEALQFRGPRQEERQIVPPEGSPGTESNGVPFAQNGPAPLDFAQNGTDTLGSLDSVPWNADGTETVRENGCRSLLDKWSITPDEEGDDVQGTEELSEEAESRRVKEENQRLKAALKEAAEVNGQWRHYHDHRQKYVQRLLTTIKDLQHPRHSAASPRQVEGEAVGPEAEVRRLKEALTRLHADHDEHVNLLEMQVRAHRDDWEAERSEKQATQTALAEAQARTALLLQELQLLQAKLADSESKRGLCWRCLTPRGEANGATTSSSSHSAQASPVPAPSAPSPGPSLPAPAPTAHDQPQAPLKGWIPVSMLHHIAFSGATPEHQTPVVQSQQQQQAGRQQGQRHPGTSSARPTTLNTGRRSDAEQPAETAAATSVSSVEPKTLGQRTDAKGTTEDRKKYEAMGARPKVLGDLQEVTGKGVGLLEDEKTAKHRARSILASAIPVSPVSSGPSTPFGSGVARSPSAPNMPKGYMPITSTVLTPINFRQPFVAHKRPSAMKSVNQAALLDSGSSSPTNTAAITSSSHTKHTNTPKDTHATVSKHTSNSLRTSQVGDRIKPSAAISQDKKAGKDQSQRNEPQSSKATAGSKKGGSSHASSSRNHSSAGEYTTISSCNATTTTSGMMYSANTAPISCSGLTAATTTVSCSSPATVTTTTCSSSSSSSSSNLNGSSVSIEALSSRGDDQSSVQKSQPPSSKSYNSKSTPQPSPDTVSKAPSNTNRISQTPCASVVESQSSSRDSTVSRTSSHDGPQAYSSDGAAPQSCSASNATAFASITVTTTAAPSATSAYSSATSSRSSSPGVSLTTFGLNSEGRGIPGAIFFALGSEQRGVRSPQPCTSPRRASTSSTGVKSPTPDSMTAGQTQRDALPPSGVKSPPAGVSSPPAPATVKEEHWWSVESPGRTGTPGRYQGGQGKLVNSTWVRLMGGQANGHQGSGLPWRTARAVSGQQLLNQARKAPSDDPVSPGGGSSSSTATFNYTPAVNSPPSSTLSSATSSAASSPPPSLTRRSNDDLRSMASKNIASAIMSYEMGAKGEAAGEGVATLTRRDLVCPSCQMLFPPDKHVHFLDHFEACRGPEYADL